MGDLEREVNESQWPSVNLAYEFVRPSYELSERRLDALDSRMHNLLVFASTVTLAVPTLVSSLTKSRADFQSIWLILGLTAFLGFIILVLIARESGTLVVVHPEKLYQKWLHFSEWEFRKNALSVAGQDFERNLSLVNRKSMFLRIMLILFFVELALLGYWAATQMQAPTTCL